MEKRIAVFIDYENQQVEPHKVIQHLEKRGKVVVRKAYADWTNMAYSSKMQFMVSSGFDLVECPHLGSNHKNIADLSLTVDALEICYEHPEIEVFAIVTGDSDFIPVINKLRARGKEVLIIARKDVTSNLLRGAADEFISVSSFVPAAKTGVISEDKARERKKGDIDYAIELFQRAIKEMVDKGKTMDIANVKNVMLSLDRGFKEKDYGFKKFRDFFDAMKERSGVMPEVLAKFERNEEREEKASNIPVKELVSSYNRARKTEREHVTMEGLKQAIKTGQPSIKPERYGFSSLDELLKEAVEKGVLREKEGNIVFDPQKRVENMLRSMNLPTGGALEKVLSSLSDIPEEGIRFGEISQQLTGSIDSLGINSVRAIFKLLFTNLCMEHDGAPFDPDTDLRLKCNDPVKLEYETIKSILKKNVFQGGISEEEVPFIARYLLGNSAKRDVEFVVGILGDMEKEGTIEKIGDIWFPKKGGQRSPPVKEKEERTGDVPAEEKEDKAWIKDALEGIKKEYRLATIEEAHLFSILLSMKEGESISARDIYERMGEEKYEMNPNEFIKRIPDWYTQKFDGLESLEKYLSRSRKLKEMGEYRKDEAIFVRK